MKKYNFNIEDFEIYNYRTVKEMSQYITIRYGCYYERESIVNSVKQTTISSKTLENYFMKCRKLTKKLTPKLTWNIKK